MKGNFDPDARMIVPREFRISVKGNEADVVNLSKILKAHDFYVKKINKPRAVENAWVCTATVQSNRIYKGMPS